MSLASALRHPTEAHGDGQNLLDGQAAVRSPSCRFRFAAVVFLVVAGSAFAQIGPATASTASTPPLSSTEMATATATERLIAAPSQSHSTPSAEAPPETIITSEQVTLFSGDLQNRFLFVGTVRIEATNLIATCDEMEVLTQRESAATADTTGSATSALPTAQSSPVGAVERIELRGSVVIQQGDRRATAGRAEIIPHLGRVVLFDAPVVTDGDSVVTGWRMVLHRDQRRVEVLSDPEAAPGSAGSRTRITLPTVPDLGYRPETAR